MNKGIFLMLSLLTVAGIAASANEEPSRRKHRPKLRKEVAPLAAPVKIAFGNVTIDTIYNSAHHSVLFITPDGGRTFIFPGESCKVVALFTMTDRKPHNAITVTEMEKDYHIMNKGDHSYLFRLTPDGFAVHRVTDKKKVTKGKVLLPVDTKDVSRDLMLEHVLGPKSKTSAFSAHEVGALLQKFQIKDARSRISSSIEGKK